MFYLQLHELRQLCLVVTSGGLSDPHASVYPPYHHHLPPAGGGRGEGEMSPGLVAMNHLTLHSTPSRYRAPFIMV